MAIDDEHGVGRTENIGGVHVEIYDDGHVKVDTERLADRIEHKIDVKVGQYTTGCIFNIAFAILFLALIAGGGVWLWYQVDQAETRQTTGSAIVLAPSKSVTWDGSSPLVCKGNDKMTVSGVTAKLDGQTAVVAQANCQLTLKDCTVTGATGIQASGNSMVRFEGGSIVGSEAAVDASANAKVVLAGAKVKGKRSSRAAANIKETKAR